LAFAGGLTARVSEGAAVSGLNLDAIVNGARWALVIVFAFAVIEKIQALKSGSAAWHPVMLVSACRRRWATHLMAGSLAVDVVAIGLLIGDQVKGGLLSAVLVVVYSIAGARVHIQSAEECRCLWKLLNTSTRRGLVVRNCVLVLLAGLVMTGSPAISMPGLVWGAALLVVVFAATSMVERHSVERGGTRQEVGTE
jgi:hypothetical protein